MQRKQGFGGTKRVLLAGALVASAAMTAGCAGGPVGGLVSSVSSQFTGRSGGAARKAAAKAPRVKRNPSTTKKGSKSAGVLGQGTGAIVPAINGGSIDTRLDDSPGTKWTDLLDANPKAVGRPAKTVKEGVQSDEAAANGAPGARSGALTDPNAAG